MTYQGNLNVLLPHTLHQCRSAEVFCSQFDAQVGYPVKQVADTLIAPEAERAIFLAGSVPLGMATNTSDLDFIVLVDSKRALVCHELPVNSNRSLAFSNGNDPLVVAEFITLTTGVSLDVQVVVTSTIKQIYSRLQRPRPVLSDGEIKTLSRLSTGWLLWQSDGYLERNEAAFSDPALDVYCCTKNFASALNFLESALTAREQADVSLARHLGSASAEMAYLAYFSSEGYSCLGRKWLAQLGHAIGAAERVRQEPRLKQSICLLFPTGESTESDVASYLKAVSEFLSYIRCLIEQKPYFLRAFSNCPEIQNHATSLKVGGTNSAEAT